MSYQVVFDPAADSDLTELYDYIAAKAGRRIARRYIGQIVDYCASFDLFPLRGTLHENLGDGVRIVGYRRRASIAFRTEDGIVTILRILYRGKILDELDDRWEDLL
jgi:plasmid stabilization system protein ParE